MTRGAHHRIEVEERREWGYDCVHFRATEKNATAAAAAFFRPVLSDF